MLVCVNTFKNATLLEITCHGSNHVNMTIFLVYNNTLLGIVVIGHRRQKTCIRVGDQIRLTPICSAI